MPNLAAVPQFSAWGGVKVSGIGEWTIENVSVNEYKKFSPHMSNIFNKAEFLALNSDKAEAVHYLLIKKGNSERFAISFGRSNNKMLCPFSASFSYPEVLKSGQPIENYEIAVKLINRYLDACMPYTASITLPPAYYDDSTISLWIFLLSLHGWKINDVDIDFYFNIQDLVENYEARIARNARKNLHIAIKNNFIFKKCSSDNEKKLAYKIIQQNRESKGYALRMTEEQVLQTMEIVPSDMFIIADNNEDIASALVYEAAPKIGLVVYWGDIPNISEKKVMNYLPYMLLKEYYKRGFKYLDIGPSTLNGRPNYGLCDFKDSIGCRRYNKLTFSKVF